VITKTYDLILWSRNHTSKFPRNHRFVLGERFERNLYGLLETMTTVATLPKFDPIHHGFFKVHRDRNYRWLACWRGRRLKRCFWMTLYYIGHGL